jgi:hypothetical protein
MGLNYQIIKIVYPNFEENLFVNLVCRYANDTYIKSLAILPFTCNFKTRLLRITNLFDH